MTIDLNHLKKVIALCRKHGLKSIKTDGIELVFGDLGIPAPKVRGKKATKVLVPSNAADDIETDGISADEMLFWSTGVVAENEGETQ